MVFEMIVIRAPPRICWTKPHELLYMKNRLVNSEIRSVPQDFCTNPPVDRLLKCMRNWLRICGKTRTRARKKNTFDKTVA